MIVLPQKRFLFEHFQISLRLVDNNESIAQVAVDFENDVHFIIRVVKFLKDVGWIKQDRNGTYQMTDDIISSKISCSKLVFKLVELCSYFQKWKVGLTRKV